MLTHAFSQICDQALFRIALNLYSLAQKFGPGDFPQDKGTAFRNEFFAYPFWFFRVIRDHLDPNFHDCFPNKVRDRILGIENERVLLRIVALCHFHMETRRAFLGFNHFWRPDLPILAPSYQERAKRFAQSYQVTLDWVLNSYRVFTADMAQTHHDLAVKPWKIMDPEFFQQLETLLTNELADSLAIQRDVSIACCWPGFALAVWFEASACCEKPAQWLPICDEHFSACAKFLQSSR